MAFKNFACQGLSDNIKVCNVNLRLSFKIIHLLFNLFKKILLQGGVASPLAEQPQLPRDTDLTPGQPLQLNQPSGSLGVIGRRSVTDLGAIGDNLSSSPSNSGGMYDQMYNLQMLEAAFHKLPQPKDSERAKSYTPVCS